MKPQPSTSAGAGVSKAGAPDGDPSPSDGAEDAVSSTSGDSVPAQDQQQEQQLVLFGGAAYLKQCQQLFGATCCVKLQRCQLPTTTVAKVEDDSDSTGSGSSSEDDDIKVLPAPPPAAPLSKKKRKVTKKKRGKKDSARKSPANCKVCKKTFCSKSYLKIHLRKHSGEKRHRCGKCRRSFWSPDAFRSHKKSRDERNGVCPKEKSSGEWRPKGAWTCKTCGKRLKNSASYLPHMRIHRGVKPFKCGECGKAFGRKDMLADHKKIHTGVWQYTCVFCDKGFHQQSNLFSHLRVHTEEMPYFCEVDGCGASFRHSHSLKLHRQSIH